jgi:hypothetical protein
VSAEESLKRAEALLEQVEAVRVELTENDDKDKAIELLGRLLDLSKEVEAELARAKREAESDAGA